MVGKTVSVATVQYLFYEKHRGVPTAEISVWKVEFQKELECFKESFESDWKVDNNSWGFIRDGNGYEVLGNNLSNPQLYFAKFVGDDHNVWHGYPADFKNKPNDKPKQAVLQKWKDGKIINKPVLRKIQQGQI